MDVRFTLGTTRHGPEEEAECLRLHVPGKRGTTTCHDAFDPFLPSCLPCLALPVGALRSTPTNTRNTTTKTSFAWLTKQRGRLSVLCDKSWYLLPGQAGSGRQKKERRVANFVKLLAGSDISEPTPWKKLVAWGVTTVMQYQQLPVRTECSRTWKHMRGGKGWPQGSQCNPTTTAAAAERRPLLVLPPSRFRQIESVVHCNPHVIRQVKCLPLPVSIAETVDGFLTVAFCALQVNRIKSSMVVTSRGLKEQSLMLSSRRRKLCS
ncbi:hypothetical protein B296_00035491 [Ensete ventricosum]|uniref:Uncharacterized protein n=1 Tax=Ensete ventricosum TaxID=4639 RepID=A0A426YA58_ENSVE|nr:hypothetical protein B296_00035491 [Ensete ventricosum]